MEYPINQSAFARAIKDTASAQRSAKFMWGGEGVFAVAGGAWLAQIAPLGATTIEIVIRSVIGGLGGLAVAFVIIFLWYCFRTPYIQRNEAREALKVIPGATPDTPKIPSPPQLIISYQKHIFGFDNGVPIITVWAEYRPTLVGNMRIESIELRLVGQHISSLDWKVNEVNQDCWFVSDNKFKLPDGIGSGEHDVTLAAFANGEWWGSQPFTIAFPEVNP